jgi:hypothetical protein
MARKDDLDDIIKGVDPQDLNTDAWKCFCHSEYFGDIMFYYVHLHDIGFIVSWD